MRLPPDQLALRSPRCRSVPGAFEASTAGAPVPHWGECCSMYSRRFTLTSRAIRLGGYLSAMRASDDRHQRSSLLREMATLVAVGRPEEAAALADAALAGGEGDREHAHCRCPPVHSAYATGPEAHELFLASLIPTHNLELIAQRSRSRRYSVCRDRSPGRFLDDLSRFRRYRRLDADPPCPTAGLRALGRGALPAGGGVSVCDDD